MASISISSAPFLRTASLASQSRATCQSQRRLVIANAAEVGSVKLSSDEVNKECGNGRRDLMFAAAAAAAVCSLVGVAIAEEPKPGTTGAKKLYAPVCVTMPTAKICHK